ncbi:MAG: tRNA (adenosine(37)-N6)-dimethylallyltransferase MiaA [Dehalococcoidia bacterium]
MRRPQPRYHCWIMTADCSRLIAIVGPTAVGKSDLALRLAQLIPAEIISADSRQVYRYMDIGTSKPTIGERKAVPHHILDVVDPDQDFSLAMYHELALTAIPDVWRRGDLPLLVGGSGLYVWSLIEGWQIPQVTPDREQRRTLEARAELEGSHSLYQELQSIDPVAAEKIGPQNARRIIRALEIYRATGQPPSQQRQKRGPGRPTLIIGLTRERQDLYRTIDCRVDRMIAAGLVDEVEDLLNRGYSSSLPSMSGIGYRQIIRFLQGEMTLSEATDKMKVETHRLARRQYAWFRLADERIRWLHAGDGGDEAEAPNLNTAKDMIEGFLAESSPG